MSLNANWRKILVLASGGVNYSLRVLVEKGLVGTGKFIPSKTNFFAFI
jgi:hypothetical protein